MPIEPLHIEPFWYTPRSERDEDGKPVEGATEFQLRPLTGYELQDVYLNAKPGEDGHVVFSGAALKSALLAGLTGWKNFGNGSPLDFNRRQPVKNLEFLDFTLTTELAAQVLEASTLTENGRKKS